MPRHLSRHLVATLVATVSLGLLVAAAASILGGAIPGPLPIFPRDNWWNVDISTAPVDPSSASYIAFVGAARALHPDFGGDVTPGGTQIYGFPYAVVDSAVTPRAVQFQYSDESDGVDHTTNRSLPFYPIPDTAMTQPHWIEGGEPGNVDLRQSSDRHMIIVDQDRRYLYELYNVFFDGSQWHAGSGAFFDLNSNARRPDGWTSADAAGLAILPGLVRYDDVFGAGEIEHALRVTVRATNGYVYPASHRAGSTAGALPMGARLRLKPTRDLTQFAPDVQKIFRAMQRYGLIVADNGSDMFVSGTYDPRWNNSVLNPAFGALKASDFEVVQLGYRASSTPRMALDLPANGAAGASFTVAGWAVDLAGAGTGVDAVHVWASSSGGSPFFVGAATYGRARGDVGTIFGSQFINSGFGLTVTGLPVGTYTLTAYAHSTITGTFNQARSVTVTVASLPAMSLDAPAHLATVGSLFYATGWAIDRTAASGSGVDAVHVWAYPNPGSGQAAVFLGVAGYGGPRSDVGAAFGAPFTNSGFFLTVASLSPGTYQIAAFAHSTVTGSFNNVRTADVTVAGPLMAIDAPPPGAIRSGPFVVAGWALDSSAANGPGVDAINIWAFPVGGGSPIFVGAGGYGAPRPDLAAIFGSQFANAGYNTTVALPNGIPSGVYDLGVYAHSPITGTFNQWRIVRLTISP